MMRRSAAACVMILACNGGGRSSRERERVDFERMRVQQRYELYGSSSGFANGQTMQHPPPGAVSREMAAVNLSEAGTDSVRSIPIDVTPRLVERGRDRFDIYCAVCHGAAGYGGSIVAMNMGIPRPPSLRSDSLRARPIGYVFGIATRGKGRMPPYTPQLSASDRWAIAAFIEQLREHGATTADEIADSIRASQIRTIDSVAAAERRAPR